ncbi:hypothetical protein CHLRE_08g369500v5 [Chlamydomonas reinhardtii]|uniref:Zinc-ribbon 15 domain-containing protein n=1 Tax=Chlamydomonas reinhardtii TaxID=3055 RepID=A0A2K3DH50_CHLRE|nr:uncharacterized protein CHLRE_08g369500v5 [Chlamydomonas reinhardtii]PNW79855.1 hypothetical protein CHLRE_08g369500v5 [Chlamydomonas reinhardtii]
MFFFLASYLPKVEVLRALAAACERCGVSSLKEKRVDQVLSLFLLPVYRRLGTPFVECDNCGWTSELISEQQEGRRQLAEGARRSPGVAAQPQAHPLRPGAPDKAPRPFPQSATTAPPTPPPHAAYGSACARCHGPVSPEFVFCPSCGLRLK